MELDNMQTGTRPVKNDPDDIEPNEIPSWAVELGVTEERLRVAIQKVGHGVAEVKQFLEEDDEGSAR